MDWAKTTARPDEKHFSSEIFLHLILEIWQQVPLLCWFPGGKVRKNSATKCNYDLTYWCLNKMADTLQSTFANIFLFKEFLKWYFTFFDGPIETKWALVQVLNVWQAITWSMMTQLNDAYYVSTGGRFKNAYELLNLRALKIPMLYKNRIFQCMSKIFCVEFQRVPLKFHTKYLTHTLKDVNFIHRWNLKSS